MSDFFHIRISQYGVIETAAVTRDQLRDEAQLTELAKELHRDAVWACLQRLGCDSALSWRQILANLQAARAQVLGVTTKGPRPRAPAVSTDSAAMNLSNLENAD